VNSCSSHHTTRCSTAFTLVVVTLFWLFLCESSLAAINTLLLVPETEGPAKKIYDEVVAGISSSDALNISIAKLNKKSTPEWVNSEINFHNAQLVIAVGNTSYRISQKLDTSATIVAGGISGTQWHTNSELNRRSACHFAKPAKCSAQRKKRIPCLQ